ncbi:MAG: hypothetical protein EU529_11840 [Promethearchaeota archaeon]|nr:MAG: hypothetical protein EU529_11840 [Candidatus Lokiarchaeota archaeon]
MLRQEFFEIPETALINYAKQIERNYNSKTASELTYYDDLRRFLEAIFPPSKGYLIQSGYKIEGSSNRPDLTVTNNSIVLFHIEAKIPGTPIENIVRYKKDHRLNDQILRYRNEGVQLLITNFTGIYLIDSLIPNEPDKPQKFDFKCILLDKSNNKFKPASNAIPNLSRLFIKTCEDNLETLSNIKKIINPLADIAKAIKNKTINLLNKSKLNKNLNRTELIAAEYLKAIRDDFKKSIFKEEKIDENILFSDLFAQTIVYGAFSAWINFCQNMGSGENFTIQKVGDYLPYGSFIRDLFLTFKNKIQLIFEKIIMELEKRFQKTEYKGNINTESIITTFYSDFLKSYDPKTAKNRGVVYTPQEIVDFMIQGIDFLLKKWLNKPDGLISEDEIPEIIDTKITKSKQIDIIENLQKIYSKSITRLRILDPASGTMAFACGLLHFAKKAFQKKIPQFPLAKSAFEKWVKTTFFSNVYTFEILMAPYVLGHIRTFVTLNNLDLPLDFQEYYLKSFLMNTLMTPPEGEPIEKWIFNNLDIGREIKEALKIRERRDIFVIMGNPPYNITSQNNCDWINEKIKDYKKGLKEKNLKILSDDYVKFIRFGQWKIEQVGSGILAFITNSRYLDGQVFSIMRQSLRKTFDRIYIVNLHGDMRKKESGNPFNIRVGIAIAFMVRFDNSPNKNASIFYMDVPETTREEKFAVLSKGFQENKFKLLTETKKNYFIEIDTTFMSRFEDFIPFDSFFRTSPTSGIMGGRDRLLYDIDKEALKYKISLFFNKEFEKLNNLKIKVNDTKSWKKSKVFKGTNLEKVLKNIKVVNYRGWDFRYIAYDRVLVEGHRMGYIDQISKRNPAITVTKSSRKKRFETAFIVDNLLEKCFMSVTDTSYAFPLYLNGELNIIKPELPYQVEAKQVFFYCYAILYAQTYRNRYDEYLRKSFPRIPFPKDMKLFYELYEKGKILADIHLLKNKISLKLELAECNPDEWKINDFTYKPSEETLYFDNPLSKRKSNKKKIPTIKGISPEAWNFSIGTIKQIEQFLKSRKFGNFFQRGLNHDELIYFLKMVTAIEKTIEILPEIDKIYKKIDVLN